MYSHAQNAQGLEIYRQDSPQAFNYKISNLLQMEGANEDPTTWKGVFLMGISLHGLQSGFKTPKAKEIWHRTKFKGECTKLIISSSLKHQMRWESMYKLIMLRQWDVCG